MSVIAIVSTRAAAVPPLGEPVQDPVYGGVYIVNYFDHVRGPGKNDYTCSGPHVSPDHRGTDYALQSFLAMDHGTAVMAAAPGTVYLTNDGHFDREFYFPYRAPGGSGGNFALVRHDDGSSAQYYHMRKGSVSVSTGERVEEGQRLGLIGSSGYSIAPHLHLEILVPGGTSVDPFKGPCNPRKGLWKEQPEYSGAEDFRLIAAGLTDVPLSDGTGTYQLNAGVGQLKARPPDALAVGRAAGSVLGVWVYFSARPNGDFEMRLIDPEGEMAWTRKIPVRQLWEYAWHLDRIPVNDLEGISNPGEWRVEVVHGGEVYWDQSFRFADESRYAPRFTPTSGRSVRLDGQAARIPLRVLDGTAGEVRFLPVGMPSGVRIRSGDDVLVIPEETRQANRFAEGLVVAADEAGEFGTYVVHFVDPQAPVDRTWPEHRPDRLNETLTGAWYNPETPGQGFFFEYFPDENLVFVGWFAFGLDDSYGTRMPDWLVATASPQRNRLAMDLQRAAGGQFLDDGGAVAYSDRGNVGTLAMVLDRCRARLTLHLREADRTLKEIPLERIAPTEACRTNDPGKLSHRARRINGNWYDPAMEGQGMFFEYIEDRDMIFGNWFTFDSNGRRTWYAMSGSYDAEETIMEVIAIPRGRLNRPQTEAAEVVGEARLVWSDGCGPAAFRFTDGGGNTSEARLVRLAGDPCPAGGR